MIIIITMLMLLVAVTKKQIQNLQKYDYTRIVGQLVFLYLILEMQFDILLTHIYAICARTSA
jgi:hypothetical protein